MKAHLQSPPASESVSLQMQAPLFADLPECDQVSVRKRQGNHLAQARTLARKMRRGTIPRSDKRATRLAICQLLIADLRADSTMATAMSEDAANT